MLIKRKKLISIAGGKQEARIPQIEQTELGRAAQLELQKVKQEAKNIKTEADRILLEAQRKLKEAEDNVNKIIAAANQQAAAIKETIYKETMETAVKEAELLKGQVKDQLKELFEIKRKVLNEANKEIIKVALELAEKIIRYKASIDPEVLHTQVTEAIKKATADADRVQVYVNPIDLKILEEKISEIERLFPSGLQIIPLSNESVDPGSCIVETKSGQLDARFSTQLQSLTNLVSTVEIKPPDIKAEEVPSESLFNKEQFMTQEHQDKTKPEDIEQIYRQDTEEFERFTSSMKQETAQPADELTEEEERLKEELLSDESSVPFVEQHYEEETNQKIDKPVASKEVQPKKKLQIQSFQEETELEDDDADPAENKTESILRTKDSSSLQISEVASELEEDPEWKDLIEEEE